MLTFFKQQGYTELQLHNDLHRVATISRDKALFPTRLNVTNVNRVPLVLPSFQHCNEKDPFREFKHPINWSWDTWDIPWAAARLISERQESPGFPNTLH